MRAFSQNRVRIGIANNNNNNNNNNNAIILFCCAMQYVLLGRAR